MRADTGWRWFFAWCALGALGCFGIAAILTVGLPILAVAVLLASLLFALVATSRVGLPGLLSGAAVVPGWIAWLNRGGPGNVCRSIPDGQSCIQEWAPAGFVIAATVLFFIGLALFLVVRRRRLVLYGPSAPAGR